MTIAKDFASKFSVALVAVAMIFSMFAPAAQAQTTEELQKMINDLLAQVAALQGKTSTAGGSCVSIPAPLTIGSTGANVTALQNGLIAAGHVIPAGATGYFGTQTRTALAAWQSANGVAPAVGFYGPLTMAAWDAKCVPADEEDEDATEEEDEDSVELSGEGTLDTFEIDDASDDEIQEGAEDEVIAELTLEAADGDIEVDRMDLKLTNVDGSDDPWDVFETISVWVDGDMVAEFDASDEDEYLDEDDGEFRFTGLELVLMEDEETEVMIGATLMSSVDDNLPNTWTVRVDAVRYFDADGVADDDDSTGDMNTNAVAEVATFDVVEAGDGEELKFGLGDNNPDATDIVVDEDSKTNDVTILEYTIEAEEGDIELNNLFVNFVVTSATTSTYASVVDDVSIIIEGEEFDGETPVTANGSTTVEFEVDGDVTIDMNSEVTVEVVVNFKSQDGNYANGDQIQARVRAQEVNATDAEGMDDVDEFSGTAVGETHTLVATGILVPVDGVEITTDTKGTNDQIGEFTIEFEVTAIEGDFYITDNVDDATSTNDGIAYIVDLGTGTATTSGVLSSTADEDTNGVFTVEEGETETFTLTVTVDTSDTTQVRITLAEINFSTNVDGFSSVMAAYLPAPASDFRTVPVTISAN